MPYFGVCLGLQIMCIELARAFGIASATSEEFSEKGEHIVHFMPSQKHLKKKGATMRLGAYDCALAKGSMAKKLYGTALVEERHRHRYEINDSYVPQLEKAGLVISGHNPGTHLPEIGEIPSHPFMLGCQFHPEFKSRPYRPHPLFLGFISAAMRHKA